MSNKAADAARYRARKAAGLCISCGKPSRPARTLCRDCATRHNGHVRAHTDRNRAAGLCARCEKPRESHHWNCAPCRKIMSDLMKAKHAQRIAAGRCIACNGPRRENGTKRFCRPCANRYNVTRRASQRRKRFKRALAARRSAA